MSQNSNQPNVSLATQSPQTQQNAGNINQQNSPVTSTATTTSNISSAISQNQSATLPVIISITPNPVSTGDTINIHGQNFDTVRTENSAMVLYTTLGIMNSTGQKATVFLSQGTANQIGLTLPSNVCMDEYIGPPGNCRSTNGYMTIKPGTYSVNLGIDGRGTSNTAKLIVR